MVKVILTSTTSTHNLDSVLSKAIKQFRYDFDDYDYIIIKPNLCYYWDYTTGETTDPRVISSLIDVLRKQIADIPIMIAEADASAMRTRHAFRMLGYNKLAKEKNVELVNLSKGTIYEKTVPVQGKKLRFKVNKLLCGPKLLINVPKLKYHRFVGLTCGLKNLFGAISSPRKIVYHKSIAETIVGINKLVPSDLTIVDGIIAKGKYPINLNTLILSSDVLKADYIAAKILGYNPNTIPYFRLAKKESVGKLDQMELQEEGTTLQIVTRMFPKENKFIHNLAWSLQLKALKVYSKLLNDIIPPVLT